MFRGLRLRYCRKRVSKTMLSLLLALNVLLCSLLPETRANTCATVSRWRFYSKLLSAATKRIHDVIVSTALTRSTQSCLCHRYSKGNQSHVIKCRNSEITSYTQACSSQSSFYCHNTMRCFNFHRSPNIATTTKLLVDLHSSFSISLDCRDAVWWSLDVADDQHLSPSPCEKWDFFFFSFRSAPEWRTTCHSAATPWPHRSASRRSFTPYFMWAKANVRAPTAIFTRPWSTTEERKPPK